MQIIIILLKMIYQHLFENPLAILIINIFFLQIQIMISFYFLLTYNNFNIENNKKIKLLINEMKNNIEIIKKQINNNNKISKTLDEYDSTIGNFIDDVNETNYFYRCSIDDLKKSIDELILKFNKNQTTNLQKNNRVDMTDIIHG